MSFYPEINHSTQRQQSFFSREDKPVASATQDTSFFNQPVGSLNSQNSFQNRVQPVQGQQKPVQGLHQLQSNSFQQQNFKQPQHINMNNPIYRKLQAYPVEELIDAVSTDEVYQKIGKKVLGDSNMLIALKEIQDSNLKLAEDLKQKQSELEQKKQQLKFSQASSIGILQNEYEQLKQEFSNCSIIDTKNIVRDFERLIQQDQNQIDELMDTFGTDAGSSDLSMFTNQLLKLKERKFQRELKLQAYKSSPSLQNTQFQPPPPPPPTTPYGQPPYVQGNNSSMRRGNNMR